MARYEPTTWRMVFLVCGSCLANEGEPCRLACNAITRRYKVIRETKP